MEKSEGLKSNEEIIEELTKDLESSCIKVDCDSSTKDNEAETNVQSVNSAADSCEYHGANAESTTESKDKVDAQTTDHPNDYVDEELLKDRELSLSDAEKEALLDTSQTLKSKGNDLFKSGAYMEAISVYTEGLQTCPLAYTKERSILYANRAAAKSKCLEKESAISDCTKAIELNPDYTKAYIRRAQLHEETEKLDEALEDFKKVLTFDPGHKEANYAVRRLPALIHERNEKLKTEMLGKLKDFGNMMLKPFGLSTNNFELQKDPNSGGYSVKFHQPSK